MAIGFDYGTANCSVAHIINGSVQQIPLVGDDCYISSTLCAPTAETVSEYLFRCLNIRPANEVGDAVLRRAIQMNRDEGIEVIPSDVLFGQQALDLYLEDPKDVYYIKSPKSFLGTIGLRDMQLSFFEDLVCAMMANVKHRAEESLQQDLTQTVIGRPVNFLGRGGDASNDQAEAILLRAANRAGFKDVAFQLEPVAAGLDYESTLSEDKNVLVVDIGGGTTDCSFIKMGPSWAGKLDRTGSLIAHTGQRVGGNDLDIYIAFRRLMSAFGMGTKRHSGLDIPVTQFWNPIAINDVQAQRKFYAQENMKELKMLLKEAKESDKVARLVKLHQDTLGYAVIREAEKAKIALGEADQYRAFIQLISEQVDIDITRDEMESAIDNPKQKIKALVQEAVKQAGIQPDVVFMTGGSARSSVLRQAVNEVLPNTPLVAGNYFGSVTAGLARWADICFK
ncbi:molecular chaperone [Vibrio cionasavignyae]|uniref:molecular chaperone n=1 Tax=Vibrio cionasavignyae TaxID=2910252 RepID=UPI003D0D1DDD